jgi:hypothetical protein
MRPYFSFLTLTALTCAGLVSCASSSPGHRPATGPLPKADPEAARAAGLTTEQTNAAFRLYTAKCIRCHKSYDPHPYTSLQWETWMTKMSRKARLDPQQQQLLTRFLAAVRTTPISADTNKVQIQEAIS